MRILIGLQIHSALHTSHFILHTSYFLADILIPQFGIAFDEFGHHADALGISVRAGDEQARRSVNA